MNKKITIYLVSILLTTIFLPFILTLIEFYSAPQSSLLLLLEKWFVFCALGLRLLIAGIRQLFNPEFTLKEIFNIDNQESLMLVKEIGAHNISLSVIALLVPWFSFFKIPALISGALYFGIAGLLHALKNKRSDHESIALFSDIAIAAIASLFLLRIIF